MTPLQIVFILTAAVTLGAALLVVTTRNMVHAALWLVLTLLGIAISFVLLSAGFIAVGQVVIYIGAISVLLIFAVMLTRRVADESVPQLNQNWVWAGIASAVMFAGLIWMLTHWAGFSTPPPSLSPGIDPLRQLGEALVSPSAYVLPFEIASVLLLAAMIGAVMVAWDRSK